MFAISWCVNKRIILNCTDYNDGSLFGSLLHHTTTGTLNNKTILYELWNRFYCL